MVQSKQKQKAQKVQVRLKTPTEVWHKTQNLNKILNSFARRNSNIK